MSKLCLGKDAARWQGDQTLINTGIWCARNSGVCGLESLDQLFELLVAGGEGNPGSNHLHRAVLDVVQQCRGTTPRNAVEPCGSRMEILIKPNHTVVVLLVRFQVMQEVIQ